MSTQAKPSVVECHGPGCKRAGHVWTYHHGKYCSNECQARAKGRRALSGLKYKHTRCFTCLAELKDIEPPKPDYEFTERGVELTYDAEKDILDWVQYRQTYSRKAACGYQSLRPEAGIGEKPAGPLTVTGAVCDECGNATHVHHIAMLADGHRTAALIGEYLADEDEGDEHDFDTELLHRRYAETGDIELAAGVAILAVD